jgi:hypothetical protein
LALSVGVAQAALVKIDFSAIVGTVPDPGFATLLTPGEQMSGSVVFEFNPPSALNVGPQVNGSFSVLSGVVPLSVWAGGAAGPTGAGIDFSGTGGPSNLISGDIYSLRGFYFRAAIDGANARLSDYLALTKNEITEFGILGRIEVPSGGTSFGPVAQTRIESFSITVAQIPEPGTLPLASLGLVAALAAGRLRRHRPIPIAQTRA